MSINGRALAEKHEEKLRKTVQQSNNPTIKVVSILIGDDPSSVMYTNMKQKKAADIGITFEPIKFSADEDFNKVAATIQQLNNDSTINGIMIQIPIPDQFLREHDWTELPHLINPEKDIDGLTPNGPFLPATAKAVISILSDEGIVVRGKNVVVIGKSELVGQPIARELTVMGARVTIVDRSTQNPAEVACKADILISAAGVPHLVKENWVKEGAVVIDVGTSELDGKIVGDVDFENVKDKASKITPSPGGVGPMTVISLLENVVESVSR